MFNQNTIFFNTTVSTQPYQNQFTSKQQNSTQQSTRQLLFQQQNQKTRAATKALGIIPHPEIQNTNADKNLDKNQNSKSESQSLKNSKKRKNEHPYIYMIDDKNYNQKDTTTSIRLIKNDKKSQKQFAKQFEKLYNYFNRNHAKNMDPQQIKNHYQQSIQKQMLPVKKFEIKGEEIDVQDLIFKEIKKDKVTSLIQKKKQGKKITKKSLNIVYKLVKHDSAKTENKNFYKQCEWLKNEHLITSKLQHPNIMSSLGYYENIEINGIRQCGMLMEEANLDLKKLINDIDQHKLPSHKLLMSNIKAIFREIIEPVRYLHSLNLAHNDLKMDNYFAFKIRNTNRYKKIDDYRLKLADFEMSRHDSQINSYKDLYEYWKLVNISYSGPEVYELIYLKNQIQFDEKKNDIFQLGLILFKMLFRNLKPQVNYGSSQKVPYLHFQNDPIYRNLIKKNYNDFWNCHIDQQYLNDYKEEPDKVKKSKIEQRSKRLFNIINDKFKFYQNQEPDTCNINDIENIKDLLQQMLAYYPSERPDINKILEHPWLQKQENNDIQQNQLNNDIQSSDTSYMTD